MYCVEDEFYSDSKENDMNTSCSKDEIGTVNFHSGVIGNQVECVGINKESGTNQRAEVANNIKSLAIDSDQFDMKTILKTAPCGNNACISKLTIAFELSAFESIVDDELKQLVAYILNTRGLKGVEVCFFISGMLYCLYKLGRHFPTFFKT